VLALRSPLVQRGLVNSGRIDCHAGAVPFAPESETRTARLGTPLVDQVSLSGTGSPGCPPGEPVWRMWLL
jgi:hypothetical protein